MDVGEHGICVPAQGDAALENSVGIGMALRAAYIVAARRTALGRLGGLHRQRRLEELAAPVVVEALKDAELSPARVERVLLGSTTGTGNPARTVSLAAGLPEQTACVSIDQSCASGLEAVLAAVRLVALGEASVVVAGGAEAVSMAPWRIAKPRGVHMTPRFIGFAAEGDGEGGDGVRIAAGDRLARRRRISREAQDEWTARSHLAAGLARDQRRFFKEIVPLRATAEEGRDQSATEIDLSTLAAEPPIRAEGTLTGLSASQPHDGAAAVVVVGEEVWDELGRPPAMRLLASAAVGVAPEEDALSPVAAMQRLVGRTKGLAAPDLDIVELGESSAAQAIAFRDVLGLSDRALDPDGGAVVRGHPLGAAGAVLVVRLFTRMARVKSADRQRLGAAVQGAAGGQGVAALFEAV